MKVGIIGVGAVGSACVALMQRGSAREIVMVDKTAVRARAVALDMRYGSPVSPTIDVWGGSYEDLKDAELVMVTAGVNEKAGGATDRSDAEGRLRLFDANVSIYQDPRGLLERRAERRERHADLLHQWCEAERAGASERGTR
jgi:L-lactate dehydrogenase